MWKDFIQEFSDDYAWMANITKPTPLIITLAVNGGMQGKEAHGAIPETIDEIVQSTYEAYKAGASVVHIHGRKPDCPWQCTDDPAVYAEINAKIQAKCPGMIVNNTTGGGITTTMEDRLRCLDARPEIASLNLGPDMSRFTLRERPAPLPSPHEKIDVDDCLPFTYGMIDKLAEKMKKNGIKPEMELYHEGQYWVVRELIAKKLIEPPYMIQFIMGYQTSAYPTLDNVIHLARALPKESVFSVAGIGKYQWHMITMAILMGGHVRVGLEDNLYERKGEFLKSNAHAVEKVVRIAKELGRPIATPAQAREILGLPEMPTGCGHD